ncbi:MAG TPA: DUF2344 domain-containing protein, partial [Anaerolineae bacterium]|nr:DUF2344 domain-containing protein [Anaerolineae bacterium]
QRLRLTFSKGGAARYISHLDLARALERALHRARIPVAYTQGFNRRPRMQMATALPLGYTSEYELADILLRERMEPEEMCRQLMARMAPGIEVYRVEEAPTTGASLQALTLESSYLATPLDPVDTAVLRQRITEIMAAETLIRERTRKGKTKAYDLRPLIYDLRLENEPRITRISQDLIRDNPRNLRPATPQIFMRLSLQPSKTGRPDEVVMALGLDPLDVWIHRLKIVLREE